MKKVFFTYRTGLCDHDGYEVAEFEDNVTDEELDQYAWEAALSNAEMYGIYPMSDDEEESYGDDEYTDSIEGAWVIYNEEMHSGYVS